MGSSEKQSYLDILKINLRQSATKVRLGRRYIIQQDGDPKYRAKIILKWLKGNKIKTLDWVSRSPDLNPIDRLWSILKRRVAERKPKNVASLRSVISDEWANIDQNVTNNLVDPTPRRIQAVIAAKGVHTKY